MTFHFTDADGDDLRIGIPATPAGPGPCISIYSASNEPVHVPLGRVEEVVAGIRDAARTASGQQPETEPCACTHPQDRHLSACTECPCIGYAPTWPPTKRRIVPVCDQCGAPWATSHRCATAPAVGQPAEAQATDRAAVLDEAADAVERENADCLVTIVGRPCQPCATRAAVAAHLRRMAEEARS